ncbi:MAG: hypothetical protein JEZ07_07865 [Phycisphaerae bacterium]|nr:hypothetical protein [Phycisphaerae bacterium]
MLRILGIAIAAPLRLILKLVGTFYKQIPFGFYQLLYKLSGDSDDGNLMIIRKAISQDYGGAMDVARDLFEKTGDCKFINMAITFAIHIYRDMDLAKQLIDIGMAEGKSNQEHVLYFMIWLAEYVDGIDEEAAIEDMLSRNDVPVNYTELALIEKADLHMQKQQWDQAEKLADRVLGIHHSDSAHWVKWICNSATENQAQAQKHFEIFAKSPNKSNFLYMISQGWYYLGQYEQAYEDLQKALQGGYLPNMVTKTMKNFMAQYQQNSGDASFA